MKKSSFLWRLAKLNQAAFPLHPINHYGLGVSNLMEAPEYQDEKDEKDGHIPSIPEHSH